MFDFHWSFPLSFRHEEVVEEVGAESDYCEQPVSALGGEMEEQAGEDLGGEEDGDQAQRTDQPGEHLVLPGQ